MVEEFTKKVPHHRVSSSEPSCEYKIVFERTVDGKPGDMRQSWTNITSLLVTLLLFTLGHRAVSGVSVHGRYTSSPLEPRIELRDARYGARDARCSARGQAATLAHAAAAAAAPTDSA